MKFDVTIFPEDLNQTIGLARQVEDYGFDGLWTAEAAHNPFLPLTLAATSTQKIALGTAIAVAFPRSPMVTAQVAWDLAAQSHGRFILGLGSQIKPNIVMRFSSLWADNPVKQMREYIESLRAIWQAFQNKGSLRYRGEIYKFGLLQPFFNPGPIAHPDIPIYLAAVNESMCKLAGEVANGIHVHPFHTVKYLTDVVRPSMTLGMQKAGRKLSEVQLSCAVFVVTGSTPAEIERNTREIKGQIGFYASTPGYRPVLDLHGWGEFGDAMNKLTKEGAWDTLWEQVPDEILHTIAVVGTPDELPYKVRERYQGLLDRVGYYFPFKPEEADRKVIWEQASQAMSA
jgi:probable F420-dependent oxidoreductase